jgi:hypothetical protein
MQDLIKSMSRKYFNFPFALYLKFKGKKEGCLKKLGLSLKQKQTQLMLQTVASFFYPS